ncbi:hypothetical protein I4P06_21635 [Enterobacter asburiae]|uniref:hypothetical protein n=1 Tax=Enterobacter asburiae TaxID=61645 RepID=UPI0018C2B72D|nr:hypothetical protein [Enterobacter asburiae]MBG0640583.1 hypothetical protein [Enterobacter asburiae]
MVVTNHSLLKFRTVSLLVSFAFATTVYVNVHDFFMFPLFLLQVASLILAIKLKCWNKEKSLRVISRVGLVLLIAVYCLAIAVGVVVSTTTSGVSNSITLLLFYVTCLDALMAIPFVMSFTDKTKWQIAGPATGLAASSVMNGENCQITAAYADSDYDLMNNEIYWPQNDYHTTSALDSSPGVNPASGLPMANDAIDVGGNVYGFGEPVFNDDSFHTNQFSDFDYHNNP